MAIEQAIDEYFQRYALAFSEQDIAGITALWDFPAYLTAEEKSVAFTEPTAFAQNTIRLCDFYAQQGVVRAQKTLLRVDPIFPRLVMARSKDELFDAADELVAEWEHSYILRMGSEGWKAITAFADGELAAWRMRGTPLGSSQ